MAEICPQTFIRRLAGLFGRGPVWRGGPSDIVATLHDDGVILAVSPTAGDIIGAAGNLVGRSIFDFVARDDRDAVRAAIGEAADRGGYADPSQFSAEFTLLRVRRAGAPAEITIRPLGRGRLTALIRQQRGRRRENVSALAEIGTQIEAQIASGDDPAIAAQCTDDGQRHDAEAHADLIGDLAHELKTPLNAIIGFADAMRSETFGPLGADVMGARKYAEYVNHIHTSGAHLSALISAAQDYAKTQAGRYEIAPASVNPAVIAEECAAMIRGAAEAAGLAFNLTVDDDLPDAMLDARAVRQILINLLSNAVKFTEQGEVTLSVRTVDGNLEFAVRDTGVGMNKVVLAKLGGRYSDTHRTGVRGAGGSGLGLSLAFELARLHGGVLRLESEPGEGTVARFTAPISGAMRNNVAPAGDIQSQLDRINAFRAERARTANAA